MRKIIYQTFTALLIPVISWATGARVCLEAENASEIELPMIKVTAENSTSAGTNKFVKGASGDCYLEIPEGVGNPPKLNAGKAVFEVELPVDGVYTLWCRVYWEGECSNSFNVQIDDMPIFIFGENATFKIWHWVRYPVSRTAKPVALSKGKHSITFFNREDGVRLDQVILSADKRFVPVDIESSGSRK